MMNCQGNIVVAVLSFKKFKTQTQTLITSSDFFIKTFNHNHDLSRP